MIGNYYMLVEYKQVGDDAILNHSWNDLKDALTSGCLISGWAKISYAGADYYAPAQLGTLVYNPSEAKPYSVTIIGGGETKTFVSADPGALMTEAGGSHLL